MKEQILRDPSNNKFQMLSSEDGRVWINDSKGHSVGRYNPHAGLDVHTSYDEQLATNKQCLDCHPGSFEDFVKSMKKHYEIEIPKG